jgi:hypothetical protein
VLQRHPVAQGAQVVSQMYIAGGLYTAKNSLRHEFSNGCPNHFRLTIGSLRAAKDNKQDP